jgi:fibronectin-binding autotransporter adhesin
VRTDFAGNAKAHSYLGEGYARWARAGSYVNAQLAFSVDSYRVNRSVVLDTGAQALFGRPRGSALGLDLEAGHRFGFGRFALTPLIGLSHDDLTRSGFAEQGSDAAALRFSRDDRTAWTGRIGGRAELAWTVGGMTVRPYAEELVYRELGELSASITPTLAGTPMTASANILGRMLYQTNAGLAAGLSRSLTFQAGYRRNDWNNGHSNAATASIRFRW